LYSFFIRRFFFLLPQVQVKELPGSYLKDGKGKVSFKQIFCLFFSFLLLPGLWEFVFFFFFFFGFLVGFFFFFFWGGVFFGGR